MLLTAQPFRDFVMVSRKLYPHALRPRSLFGAEGVAPGAIVHPSAEIEDDVTIDPGAVIGPRAAIGAGTVIGANAVVGPGVQIGRDCSVGPGASMMHALIGDNVILHGGCRIGQDGFRYQPSATGHVKVPQLGRVIVQDNVEIGANTTIDRGGSGDTVIGEGTKIDNLVQIGHNCTIGRHCIIVSECGLSGSVMLGDHVMLGRSGRHRGSSHHRRGRGRRGQKRRDRSTSPPASSGSAIRRCQAATIFACLPRRANGSDAAAVRLAGAAAFSDANTFWRFKKTCLPVEFIIDFGSRGRSALAGRGTAG